MSPFLLAAPMIANAEMSAQAGFGGQKFELRGTAVVLYDQTGQTPRGNGVPDQNFETSYDAYDSFAADDFVISGDTWIVTQVDTIGTTGTGDANSATVSFHADDMGAPNPTPLPGCEYTSIPITAQNAGALTIVLPSGCEMGPGTYWMAIQVNQDFSASGQHFFSNTDTVTGSEAHWMNPGDGFGTGCTTWSPAGSVCGVGGSTGNEPQDYLFSLSGSISDLIFKDGFEGSP